MRSFGAPPGSVDRKKCVLVLEGRNLNRLTVYTLAVDTSVKRQNN